MKARNWTIGWFILVVGTLATIGFEVIKIDPYFHYHKPDLSRFYYSLDNERSQNDGISKHFDYDALITGTSMTENFKASEMDEIFGVNSIKVSYSGGSYKEINDNLVIALDNNPNLKVIVRGLDYAKFLEDRNLIREDLGTYPTYLYDSNPFNDVKYLFNKDVIFGRVYAMKQNINAEGFKPGITSFDDYSLWQYSYTFGINTVLPNGVTSTDSLDAVHLTEEEKNIIYGNITQNVTSLANEHPNVDFYYFFSPYSAAWWNDLNNDGTIYKQIEAEKYVIELILQHPNIHLYSFNNRTDITTDLNNYKDAFHYGQWINSLMLRWMKDGKYLLTEDNYQEYLDEELKFYTSFNYSSLNNQIDYESDFYAAALLNKEYKGAEPLVVLGQEGIDIALSNAEIVENQFENGLEIQCTGRLQREPRAEVSVEDYIAQNDYAGAKITIDDIGEHDYLVFYGKKLSDHGQPTVYVYDNQNGKVAEITANYHDLDNEWHQYVIDLSNVDSGITVILNGGYIDNMGSAEPKYVFSGITLY